MADTTPPAGLLRPLGFGELFDRAVTLYVRNFVPLSLIVLVVMVPLALAQYSVQSQQLDQLAAMMNGAGRGTHADPLAAYSTGTMGLALLLGFVFLLVVPFALNAVALGVARLYTGGAIDFRAWYARAFKRFWPTIGMLAMDLVVLGGAYIALIIAVALTVGIAVALGALGKVFAVVGIVVTIALGLALIGVFVLLAIAMGFAMFAVVIEEKSVFDAIGEGFGRVFSRSEVGRALLFALATFVITLANALLVYGFMGLAIWLHQTWLLTLENVVVSTVVYAFSTVLFAVYYYDVRIRREGLDLESQLESLVSTAPA